MKILRLSLWPTALSFTLLLFAGFIAGPTAHAQTPRLFLDPGGHTSAVRQVLYTPDGKHLISVGTDKSIRVWDTSTAKELGKPIYGQVGDGAQGKLFAAALDPAGKTLAVAGYTFVGEAEPDVRKNRCVIRVFHLDGLDGRSPAATLQLLLPGTDHSDVPGHANTILALAFSPDGRRLASGSADTTVRLWNVPSGSSKMLGGGALYDPDHADSYKDKEHQDSVTCVAWSPDGRQIASGSWDKTVRLWDADSGESIKTLDVDEKVLCLAWSPRALDDGHTLLIGTKSEDEHTGSLYSWDFTQKNPKRLSRQEKPVSCAAYSADGRFAAIGQDIGDGGSHAVHLWPASRIGDSSADRVLSQDSAVQAVAFSPMNDTLASGAGSGDIFLWSLTDTSAARRLGGSGGPMTGIAWSADGKKLHWKSRGKPFVYELDHAYCHPGDAPGPWNGPVLDDGRGHTLTLVDHSHAAAFSSGASVTFPQAPSDQNDPSYLSYNNDYVTSETFTRDGKGVVIGSGLALRLFNAADGRLLCRFVGHTADVLSVAVSPDGSYLASASRDQTVRIWRLGSGDLEAEPLLSIFADDQPNYVAWAPSGYYACSSHGQSMIGWQRNQGDDARASYDPAESFPVLRHPDVISALWSDGVDGDILKAIEKVGAPETNVDKIRPPTVDSLNIKEGQQVPSAALDVSAQLHPGSSPLAFVKVAVNGHVKTTDTLSDTADRPGAALTRHWRIPLDKGQDNTISITVYDKPDTEGLQPTNSGTSVLVHCTAAPAPPHQPRLILLTIGVKRYLKFLDLLYPDKDALGIQKDFEDQVGPGKLFSKITAISLVNKAATKKGIEDALNQVKGMDQDENDYTVVFVAGHGGQTDSKHYYFLPYDVDTSVDAATVASTAVNWDDFYAALKGLPSHVVVFLDTCHSAGAKETQSAGSASNDQTNNLAYRELLAELASDADNHTSAVTTLASCGAGQTSQELTRYQHGAFAEAVIEGLQAVNNPAHPDAAHQVKLRRLYSYLVTKVNSFTHDQQDPETFGTGDLDTLPIAVVSPQAASR